MTVRAISARDIAVSGMRAQRARINVIANNVANAETTRTPEGGAFRRQLTVFRGYPISSTTNANKVGVKVKDVVSDPSALRMVYNPSHPDANAEGYVAYPNISVAVEMVDLISAQRAYDANVSVFASHRRMDQKALEIIQK